MKKIITILFVIIFSVNHFSITAFAASVSEIEEIIYSPEIQEYISKAMKAELAPAVSIAVSNGDETVYYNRGLADVKNNISADENTLYQIGSVTKAFTALGILILDDDDLISLNDTVSKYLPWFQVFYKGEPTEITIKQLIYHSSGIPNSTMNQFPEGTSDNLKEQTARIAEGVELNFAPGTQYEYCNLGYNILGHLIEVVTGQKYEDYIKEKILLPLGMTDSGFHVSSQRKAVGYLQFFGRAAIYNAPRYQGCLADGYLVTSAKDMSKWLNVQLGKGNPPQQLARLIEKSHTIDADNKVIIGNDGRNDYYYAYGWEVSADGAYFSHAGLNPNYTSQVIVSLEKETAVFVVSNIAGTQASNIGNALMCDIYNMEYPPITSSLGNSIANRQERVVFQK